MKRSELTFVGGFTSSRADEAKSKGVSQKVFDWDKAASIIKETFKEHPDLTAEAGLQGDWAYTGGVIFENSLPTNDSYTYLSSNWATPTLILSWDGCEQRETPCFLEQECSRFNSGSKWDEQSLEIIGLPLKVASY